MGRPKKQVEEIESIEVKELKPVKKEPKKVTSQQALNILSGNPRLHTYVGKKFKGQKSVEEWKEIFKFEKIY